MSNPQEIQQQIERTRADLSDDVDRLAEKVSPPRVMSRQVNRATGRMASLRDRVMGSAGDGVHGTSQSLGSTAGSAKDAVAGAPDTVRSQTQGNPLAAGLVAFGVGMVISSLLPASSAEQQLADRAESKAKDFADPAKHSAQQLAEDLKPAAHEAVDQVRSTAQDAAQETTAHARSAADDATTPLRQP